MALSRKIVVAVGIDDRHRRRQRAADLMVVEHHDIGAGGVGRVDGSSAVGAAVDGDDQRRAPRDTSSRMASRIGAIAFEDPVGDVDLRRSRRNAPETA